ncbi:hypothetical protein O6H91_Y483000 [Diphasiastrum complanatum]|nr:hypothetical protein O6H91_Y483000 [Diphasiastrum complanatum]
MHLTLFEIIWRIRSSISMQENYTRDMWRRWRSKIFRRNMLVWWTIAGVCVGIALGAALYNADCSGLVIELIGYPGEIFIRALQALVLPLIVFALMSGVFSLRRTPNGVGQVTRWSLIYYLLSMLLAVGLGIGLVYAIRPGHSAPFSDENVSKCSQTNSTATSLQGSAARKSTIDSLLDIGRSVVPVNLVAAAAQPNYLGVVSFSIVFAFAIISLGEQAESLISLVEVCNQVVLNIIFAVITCTPIGVASLIASTILKACKVVHLLKALGLFISTVLVGFFIHSLLILPLTVVLLSKRSPLKIFRAFLPALSMGFGTSSSAATMPVTMQCGEDYGCKSSIVRYIIPFGTNINRDGAALYEAVAVLFICQAHGLTLSASEVVILTITATIAAIGSASIPNAALVSMITVLQALGLSEYIGDVSILYATDWLLGMFRTSVNIWGDACACVIVDAWAARWNKDESAARLEGAEADYLADNDGACPCEAH